MALGGPSNPRGVLFDEVGQGVSDPREVFNKTAIKVGEPEKSLQVSYISWWGPVCDCLDFYRVHSDFFSLENKSKILDL